MIILLKQLESKLKAANYDLDVDDNGIYVTLLDIDIVVEDESYLVSIPENSETSYHSSVDEVLEVINRVNMIYNMKEELRKNNLSFKDVDSHMIYVKDFSIFYENSSLWLESVDGEVSSHTTPSSVIANLEDYQVL